MTNPQEKPELIPYASHIAHGTGRTPIGIVLFAASHVLLGAWLLFKMGEIAGAAQPTGPSDTFFTVAVLAAATSMLGGGTALLLKGRGAWIFGVVAFTSLGAWETALATWAVAEAVAATRTNNRDAVGAAIALVTLCAPLFALCVIVLGYLASAKARKTFALPAGETPTPIRWLPRVAVLIFIAAVVFGWRFVLWVVL